MAEKIILVNRNGEEIGVAEKMEAHRRGKLHRAFSIFIFNAEGRLLLQKREKEKYHCGGLWSNTCCSHPRSGETLEKATQRRLKEEMGFDAPLNESFYFIYQAKFNNGLTEHEYDHVFTGKFNGDPDPNQKEVDGWKWVLLNKLKEGVDKFPEQYTPWLKIIVNKYPEYLKL